MGASVRIEDEAFSDERYEDLAAAAGLADGDHARGKMAKLWRQCTLETRYVLPRETVLRILGEHGIDALVSARLGEVVEDGVRIRGTKGRIEWLQKLRKNGRFGKRGGRPKSNPDGFRSEPLRVSDSGENETPPAPAPAPIPVPTDQRSETPRSQERSAATKRSKARTQIPEDWRPRPQEADLAKQRGLDPESEVVRFRDFHRAKGNLFADANAAFRTWLGNAQRFARDRQASSGHQQLRIMRSKDDD